MRLAVLGEVPRHVIDHSIRAQGSHELEVLGVAHRGDVSAEVPGQLHHRGADGPRRAIGYGPPDGQHIVEVARPIPNADGKPDLAFDHARMEDRHRRPRILWPRLGPRLCTTHAGMVLTKALSRRAFPLSDSDRFLWLTFAAAMPSRILAPPAGCSDRARIPTTVLRAYRLHKPALGTGGWAPACLVEGLL